MSTLLLKIHGHPLYNGTIFPPILYLYDDILVYKRRRWFVFIDETTMAYSHIVQVNLHKGIIFADLEIVNTGVNNPHIKFVLKASAEKAKKLIDQKIYFSLAKEKPREDPMFTGQIYSIEKSLGRLKELVSKGKMSEREFDQKRKQLIKRVK